MIRKLLISIVVIIILWLGCFAFFVHYTNSLKVTNFITTDLIAVVSGGRQRIETGVKLLNAGYAPILFISGANPENLKNYMKENRVNAERLIYGPDVGSVNEKIAKIVEFVNDHRIKSLRIVTSSYNMPKVFEHLRELAPVDLVIISNPVLADHQSYKTMLAEYNEYLITYFLDFIR